MKLNVMMRVISIGLVLCMVLGLLPPVALATDNQEVKRYTVLLLDTEGGFTMGNGDETIYEVETPIESIKQAANKFVEQVQSADGENYVAIVTYCSEAKVEADFSANTKELSNTIKELEVGTGFANINEALLKAGYLLDEVEEPTAIKNIVLFTQGVPGEGEYSTIGKYTIDDCTWIRSSTGVYIYEYANATYETAQDLMDKYNLYSIGLFQSFEDVPAEGHSMLEFAKQFSEDVQNSGFQDVENVDDLVFVFGELAGNIAADSLEQLYIDQHIQYANSENFSNDIIQGYSTSLLSVLKDAQGDWGVKSYDVVSFITNLFEGEVDLDESDVYEILLAEIMFSMQGRTSLEATFTSNLSKQVVDVAENLLDDIADSETKAEVRALLSKLMKCEIGSGAFNTTLSKISDKLAGRITVDQAVKKLSSLDFVAGLGIDAIVEACTTVEEVIQYISYGNAYMQTSGDFKRVLIQMVAEILWCYDDEGRLLFLDGEIVDVVGEDVFIEVWSLQDAIISFLDGMETYKKDNAKAIADFTMEAAEDGLEGFGATVLKKAATEFVDALLSCVPVLRWLPAIRDGFAAGRLLMELLTNVEERDYSADMLEKLYCISYFAAKTTIRYKQLVSGDDVSFADATLFDESVSVYRAVNALAAEYGVLYEEQRLEAALLPPPDPWRIIKCAENLSKLADEKFRCEEIRCHSVGLNYDHKTGQITYDSTKLKIFVIACPVDVTVIGENGEVAYLSGTNDIVADGYEKYFFTLDIGSGDYMKVAIVPSTYDIILHGTGTGIMDAYVANYVDGKILDSEVFNDIPVMVDSVGYFIDGGNGNSLEDLVVDGTVYTGDIEEYTFFADIKESDYFYIPVLWAYTNNITTGTTPTTFSPNNACTRAQIVTFLWRAMGEPEPQSNTTPFTDLNTNEYYYKAVLWAVEEGITTGMSATAFEPNRACTRSQAVTFQWRAAGCPTSSANNPFADIPAGQWYTEAVLWAVEQGITTGMSADKFAPNDTCTRAHIVTFLYRNLSEN